MKRNKSSKGIIGIKVGTGVVTNGVGTGMIDKFAIKDICRQCCMLLNQGQRVFIVTSGAVASGYKEGRSKNLRSAIGQPRLMMCR